MARKYCVACEEKGTLRYATHVLAGGKRPLCEDCWHREVRMRLQHPESEALIRETSEEKPRPIFTEEINIEVPMKQRKEINWNAVQQDLNAGMKMADLVLKYGVSSPTIYLKTRPPPKNGNGVAPAINLPPPKLEPRSQAGLYENVLADLRSRRDKLNQAIEIIEALD